MAPLPPSAVSYRTHQRYRNGLCLFSALAKQQQGHLDDHLQCQPCFGVVPLYMDRSQQQDHANQLAVLNRIFPGGQRRFRQGEYIRELTAYRYQTEFLAGSWVRLERTHCSSVRFSISAKAENEPSGS